MAIRRIEAMNGCFVAGADPELMLINKNGALTSAIPLINGTKENPQKVKGGAIQRDNVMAEFNVDPATTDEEFIHNIRTVMGELSVIVKPNILIVQAYAEFPEKELDHEEAKVFGCDPDFCAWPNDQGLLFRNSVPSHKALEPYRSAGGHFHIGYKKQTKEMLLNDFGKIEVVKMLDIFQGIPSVLLDPDKSSPNRRSLYGTAGAHRPKPYGVEYRALGNFWLRSPELVSLMYALANIAVELTLNNESEKILNTVRQEDVQDIINNSKPRKARKVLIDTLKHFLSDDIFKQIKTLTATKAAKGFDLYKTWGIT